ncbi:kelch-like protein 5 isoform X2 [Paramacrobiotus metropolitanus]|uniref:kelch-like protein 5 isoform X2 n=1 Tax=Paramacrobiotus metropolitanus TaxID=2943436 RepID=UPI00244651C7|nr:kelch-like protein 5 isoform X2 [Paramacrobiotus metropolitanus]
MGLPNVIVCVGGCDDHKIPQAAVTVFSPSTSTFWCLEKMSYSIALCGSVVMEDNSVFVCGGLTTTDETNRVSRYYPVHNTWESVAPLQHRWAGSGVAALGGRVYVAGGYYYVNDNWEPLRSVECYDVLTDSWQRVAQLPVDDLWGCSMVAVDDRVYMFGGISQQRKTNAVFCYDPTSDTGSRLADMPTARNWCCACVGPRGLVYVIGGRRSGAKYLNCVEAYDTTTNVWLKKREFQRDDYQT